MNGKANFLHSWRFGGRGLAPQATSRPVSFWFVLFNSTQFLIDNFLLYFFKFLQFLLLTFFPMTSNEKRKSVQIVIPVQDDLQPAVDNLGPAIGFQTLAKSVKSAMGRFWELRREKEEQVQKRQSQHSQHHHHHHHMAKKVPIRKKIHPRYLELEPLCCLSSCLVRTGCCAVVVFDWVYVLVTGFVIALKIYDGGRMDIWDELDVNFNAIVTHQTALYLLGLFCLVMLLMGFCLLYGLLSFERSFVKFHWRFTFFALGFNVAAFVFYVFALNSEGPETWTWKNVVLVMAFASQIPLQLWAISVVKACYDFYVLLYVFVTLAEK